MFLLKIIIVLLSRILTYFYAKNAYQWFFERLLDLATNGLNYGMYGKYSEKTEENTLRIIKNNADNKNKIYLMDIGANVGNYSIQMHRIFSGIDHQIYSFEPSKKTYEQLCNNLKKNELTQQILPFQIGFSDKKSELEFYNNADGSEFGSIYKQDIFGNNFIKETIQLNSLDEFCEEKHIKEIHFVKIDVEGHELNVLKGALHLLANEKINFIQFEFGGCNIHSKTFLKDIFLILDKNYIIYRTLVDGWSPISKYNPKFEIFSYSNLVAVKRGLEIKF
jgi:FkbM family methyltransferase